jgi:hypothetical protein
VKEKTEEKKKNMMMGKRRRRMKVKKTRIRRRRLYEDEEERGRGAVGGSYELSRKVVMASQIMSQVYEHCNYTYHMRNCAFILKVSRSRCTQSSVTFRSVELTSFFYVVCTVHFIVSFK